MRPPPYLCPVLLKTTNLHFSYPKGPTLQFPDLELIAGESLLITGESGCGKTTLLHLLAGLLAATTGSVRINEQPLEHLRAGQKDQFRGEHIGLVFQQPHFVSSLTLRENWMTAAWCARREVDRNRLEELGARLELTHLLDKKTEQLSAGEKQRASIARAVINRPILLLADEPTSALDDRRCAQVLALLQQEAHAAGAALVMVTHDARVRGQFSNVMELMAKSPDHQSTAQ